MQFSLTYSKLKPYIFCYLALPFLIFALTWLNFGWTILAAVSVLFILICSFWKGLLPFSKKFIDENNILHHDETLKISLASLIVTLVIAIIWSWWTGIGGWFYQCSDFAYRNALFRDLIQYDWPVIYGGEKGSLSYYIGFWIPAAFIGKLFYITTDNSDLAWNIGNTCLYLWTVLGVYLTFILLYFNVKANTLKKVLSVMIMFIFFGGMDIIGILLKINPKVDISSFHIEWWATYRYQLSSFTTCLFWVFNQCLLPWIASLCLFQEKTPTDFVFLGMMCLFNGPFPFCGFICFAIVLGIQYLIKNRKNWKALISQFFSVSNILSCLFIFPIIGSFFSSNAAAEAGTHTSNLHIGFLRLGNKVMNGTPQDWFKYLLFLILEFLIIVIIIYAFNKKDPLFHVTIVLLCCFPFIHAGTAADFGMRGTIPPLVYLFLCTTRFLLENFSQKNTLKNKLLVVCLVMILGIGAITPGFEFARGINHAVKTNSITHIVDSKKSLGSSKVKRSSIKNFTCQHYEDSTFYKYFAKGK